MPGVRHRRSTKKLCWWLHAQRCGAAVLWRGRRTLESLRTSRSYECAQNLPHHSVASFTTEITRAAYETVPASYRFTEKDVSVSQEHQKSYFKMMEEFKGSEIDVIRKPWGRCPHWSRPGEGGREVAKARQ
ncbi:hypothetical protein PMIN04_003470 [Paraphaeosphaeria minitans]